MAAMNQIAAFRAAAAEQGATPAEIDTWLATTRICLELTTAGTGPVAGQIGGHPIMPDDQPWPKGPTGEDLPLLAAIDCAALPRDTDAGNLLPADGRLLFFMNYDEYYFDGGEGFTEQDYFRVLHVPSGGSEHRGEQSHDRVDLFVTVRLTCGDNDFRTDGDDSHPLTRLALEFWPAAGQPGPDRLRIGGHGDVAHNSPETTVVDVLAERGEVRRHENWEEFSRLHDQVMRDWIPLAQFGLPGEDDEFTNARFMIRRADLAEPRFDRVISSTEFGG